MNKMLSFCGLLCSDCGAFLATQADDNKKRAEVAQLWSKQYGVNLKPEDINCDGCISNSARLVGHTKPLAESRFGGTKVCEIRKCGKQKGLANCAHCSQYPCEKLSAFFKLVPDAKSRLDEAKRSL